MLIFILYILLILIQQLPQAIIPKELFLLSLVLEELRAQEPIHSRFFLMLTHQQYQKKFPSKGKASLFQVSEPQQQSFVQYVHSTINYANEPHQLQYDVKNLFLLKVGPLLHRYQVSILDFQDLLITIQELIMFLPHKLSFSYLGLFLLFIFLEAPKQKITYFKSKQTILSTSGNNFLID